MHVLMTKVSVNDQMEKVQNVRFFQCCH